MIASPSRVDDSVYVQDDYAGDGRPNARAAFWTARTGLQPQEIGLPPPSELSDGLTVTAACRVFIATTSA